MSSIVLTGLGANDPVPGNYVQVSFAQGQPSLGTETYAILLMGNKTSSGSATADTVVYGPDTATTLSSEDDAITLFGIGSELHRMYMQVAKRNKITPIYAIAVAASAGTASTRDHVIANAATGNGNLRVWVGTEFVDTPVVSGTSAANIASAVRDSINSKAKWPVTASVVTSTTVRITAKHAGPRGDFIRTAAEVTSGIATTVSNGSVGYLSSGATADDNTNALATILPNRYYYIVSAAEDSTQFLALVNQINTQAEPTSGIRQRAFAGYNKTVANAQTLAGNFKTLGARAEIVFLEEGDMVPCEMAAACCAIYALEEVPFPFRTNFAGYGTAGEEGSKLSIPAPRSGNAPTRSELVSLLNGGITPIGVKGQTTYIVDRITLKYETNSLADYRIRDAHKVTVCDRYADDLMSKFGLQFSGKKIGNDPAEGAALPDASIVTPRVLKAAVNALTEVYNDAGLLQNLDEIREGTTVVRETSPSTRMSVRVPLQPVDNLKQTATRIDQVA